jgi:hypothetical protein
MINLDEMIIPCIAALISSGLFVISMILSEKYSSARKGDKTYRNLIVSLAFIINTIFIIGTNVLTNLEKKIDPEQVNKKILHKVINQVGQLKEKVDVSVKPISCDERMKTIHSKIAEYLIEDTQLREEHRIAIKDGIKAIFEEGNK